MTIEEIKALKGQAVISRSRPGHPLITGKFTGGFRNCPPDICHGRALGIRWETGELTYVCEHQLTKTWQLK